MAYQSYDVSFAGLGVNLGESTPAQSETVSGTTDPLVKTFGMVVVMVVASVGLRSNSDNAAAVNTNMILGYKKRR